MLNGASKHFVMEGALRTLIIKVKRKWSTHKGVMSLASHKDK